MARVCVPLSAPKKDTGGALIAVTHGGGDGPARAESDGASGRALWLNLVLTAHSTLRGASAVWNVLRPFVPGLPEAPDWTTGRTWLLRLGCDRLRCPKEQATDWIWFIDHTVQIGPQKVLLIIGIRASCLPVDRPLRLADREPIALVPTLRADTAHVHEAWQQATTVTGVPPAILGDHAAELVGGIARFREDHPQTRPLYDLKHKAACLLKRLLEADPRFAQYSRQMAQCKFQVAQTELDFLVPPSGRRKARFMNLEKFVGWGRRTLQVLERPSPVVVQHVRDERLEQKLGWLRESRAALAEWTEWLTIIDAALRAVRCGLTRETPAQLATQLPKSEHASTESLRFDLLQFVSAEAAQLAQGERLPLLTEVLESCFGRLKFLEGDQQQRGFSALLLSLGALVGTWTPERIAEALHRTPVKAIHHWVQTHLGLTHHSKRRLAYAGTH